MPRWHPKPREQAQPLQRCIRQHKSQSRCGMRRGELRLRCLRALLRGRFGTGPQPRAG